MSATTDRANVLAGRGHEYVTGCASSVRVQRPETRDLPSGGEAAARRALGEMGRWVERHPALVSPVPARRA